MRIFIFLSLVLILFSCKSKKELSDKEAQSTKKQTTLAESEIEVVEEKPQVAELDEEKSKIDFPENAVARIQRTACFGRCPIYILTVYKDGSVIYEGTEWVENKGTFYAKANTDKYAQLLKRAEEINFFGLQDVYDSESVTDLPSTIITLRKDDELKQVVNRYQGPEKLTAFGKYFDELYSDLNWAKQDGE